MIGRRGRRWDVIGGVIFPEVTSGDGGRRVGEETKGRVDDGVRRRWKVGKVIEGGINRRGGRRKERIMVVVVVAVVTGIAGCYVQGGKVVGRVVEVLLLLLLLGRDVEREKRVEVATSGIKVAVAVLLLLPLLSLLLVATIPSGCEVMVVWRW